MYEKKQKQKKKQQLPVVRELHLLARGFQLTNPLVAGKQVCSCDNSGGCLSMGMQIVLLPLLSNLHHYNPPTFPEQPPHGFAFERTKHTRM